MNVDFNNTSTDGVEQVENRTILNAKFKKFELLIFLGCLFFAFMMWCYATYLDDPIIQKEVNISLELDGGQATEWISPVSTYQILIYGEESVISSIYEIKISVNREQFDEETKEIFIELTEYLPEDVYTHVEGINVKLITR